MNTYKSIGLNPFFVNTKKVAEVVKETFKNISVRQVNQVFFYGASCSSPDRCSIIANGLAAVFTNATIETEHDMLGAARGLFGNNKGIAIILGTGSNSCIYDGKDIIENIPALGYILGDEGSGAFFGLQLIKDFLNNEMPKSLSNKFQSTFNLDRESIFNNVYNQPFPNRYLAQFVPFCSENIEHDYISQLVTRGFDLFFKRHVLPYANNQKLSLGCVGSVGFYLQEPLKQVAKQYELKISVIEKSPVTGLINFHKKSRLN